MICKLLHAPASGQLNAAVAGVNAAAGYNGALRASASALFNPIKRAAIVEAGWPLCRRIE